jgi:Sel1 repeat
MSRVNFDVIFGKIRESVSHAITAIVISITTMILVLGYKHFFASDATGQLEAIRVTDAVSKQPIPNAQIQIINPTDITYFGGRTDDQGIYLLNAGSSRRNALVAEVTTFGHIPTRVPLTSKGDTRTLNIELVASQATGKIAEGYQDTVRLATLSGAGANWSPANRVCSNPPRSGFRLAQIMDFHLEGDRRCGAWAECRVVEQDENHVCWEFRLQGHSESPTSNQSVSTGVLTVNYEPEANDDPERRAEDLWMGRGVPRNYKEAMYQFGIAAAQGNPRAMANLGWMYQNGLGTETDYSKAYEWYLKAAESGDAIANWNIGKLYEDGRGVLTDSAKARQWFSKGAALGDFNSQKALAELDAASK